MGTKHIKICIRTIYKYSSISTSFVDEIDEVREISRCTLSLAFPSGLLRVLSEYGQEVHALGLFVYE